MNTCLSCGRYVGPEALPDGGRFCPHCGALVADGSAGLLDQVLNDKYRVLSELGEGSMGRVYLGEHIKLQKKVAIKVLRPDLLVSEDSIKRFQREGVTAGQFNHPNAIQIFDLDRSMGLFYLAMEYVDGKSLGEILLERGHLAPRLAIDLTRQILAALAAAHLQGIVHRDLKPDNVMVSGDLDKDPLVKVLDFGLSKLVHTPDDASLRTQTGMILGTPLYMAPEQCAGEEADQRSDLFSVGLVLLEMLSGGLPLRGQNISRILIERATHDVPSVHDLRPDLALPVGLDPILRRALQMSPGDRYATANEMIKDLDAVDLGRLSKADPSAAARARAALSGDGSSTVIRPVHEYARTMQILLPSEMIARKRRRRRAIGVVGVLAVFALAVVYAPLWRDAAADAPGSRGPSRVRERAESSWSDADRGYLSTLDEARIAIAAGDLLGARARLLRAHQSAAADAEAFLIRGELLARGGDLDTARLDFQEALHRDPSFADAAVALGFAELDLGYDDRARDRFTQALSIHEGHDDAQVGMAAIAAKEGRDDDALSMLAGAIQRGNKTVRALLLRGQLLLRQGDAEAAVKSLMDAKRIDSTAAGVLATLGQAYLAANRLEEAERELRVALTQNPEAESAAIDLATLLLELDRTAEALTVAEDSLDRLPRSTVLTVVRGLVLLARNDPEGAIAALKKASSRGTTDPRVEQLLATLQLDAGAIANPDALPNGATEGDNADDLALRGLARFQAGDYEGARDDFAAVVDTDDESVFAHKALGVLYMDHLPDTEGLAITHLKRVIELRGDRDCAEIHAWIQWIRARG